MIDVSLPTTGQASTETLLLTTVLPARRGGRRQRNGRAPAAAARWRIRVWKEGGTWLELLRDKASHHRGVVSAKTARFIYDSDAPWSLRSLAETHMSCGVFHGFASGRVRITVAGDSTSKSSYLPLEENMIYISCSLS